jgi:hypothetical protein
MLDSMSKQKEKDLFMSYDALIAVMNPLALKKKARCVVQGSVIFIESKPKQLNKCVASSGVLRWQVKGAKSLPDPASHSIGPTQEVGVDPKYIPFRYMTQDVADVAGDWREILDDFAERDHTSVRLVN